MSYIFPTDSFTKTFEKHSRFQWPIASAMSLHAFMQLTILVLQYITANSVKLRMQMSSYRTNIALLTCFCCWFILVRNRYRKKLLPETQGQLVLHLYIVTWAFLQVHQVLVLDFTKVIIIQSFLVNDSIYVAVFVTLNDYMKPKDCIYFSITSRCFVTFILWAFFDHQITFIALSFVATLFLSYIQCVIGEELLWDASEEQLDHFGVVEYYSFLYLDPYYFVVKCYILFCEWWEGPTDEPV